MVIDLQIINIKLKQPTEGILNLIKFKWRFDNPIPFFKLVKYGFTEKKSTIRDHMKSSCQIKKQKMKFKKILSKIS